MRLTGTASGGISIEATTDFEHWLPVYTNAIPNQPFEFLDQEADAYPWRFYQIKPWPWTPNP